jgi:hypothetical protein
MASLPFHVPEPRQRRTSLTSGAPRVTHFVLGTIHGRYHAEPILGALDDLAPHDRAGVAAAALSVKLG